MTVTMRVRDERPEGTPGGSAVAGSWVRRNLNTTVENTITGASLSDDVVTLPAGVYEIEATAPAHKVGGHRLRLESADGTLLLGGSGGDRARVVGRVELSEPTAFEVHHRVEISRDGDGFGHASNVGPEVFTEVTISKID